MSYPFWHHLQRAWPVLVLAAIPIGLAVVAVAVLVAMYLQNWLRRLND